MLAIAFSVGARFPGAAAFTVIEKLFVSLSDPSEAQAHAESGDPTASPLPGATWTLPVVAFVVVTVMNAGPVAFVNVKASPSGSLPVMIWSAVPQIGSASCREAFSVGARFTLLTTIVNDF